MPLDITDLSSGLIDAMAPLLRQAYERGRQDALNAIITAATSPTKSAGKSDGAVEPSVNPGIAASEGVQANGKAPRGLVPKVVQKVLAENPWTPASKLTELVVATDRRIAPRSVSNELIKNSIDKGGVYQRDEDGRWAMASITGSDKSEAEEGEQA